MSWMKYSSRKTVSREPFSMDLLFFIFVGLVLCLTIWCRATKCTLLKIGTHEGLPNNYSFVVLVPEIMIGLSRSLVSLDVSSECYLVIVHFTNYDIHPLWSRKCRREETLSTSGILSFFHSVTSWTDGPSHRLDMLELFENVSMVQFKKLLCISTIYCH